MKKSIIFTTIIISSIIYVINFRSSKFYLECEKNICKVQHFAMTNKKIDTEIIDLGDIKKFYYLNIPTVAHSKNAGHRVHNRYFIYIDYNSKIDQRLSRIGSVNEYEIRDIVNKLNNYKNNQEKSLEIYFPHK